jgi:hypothetical protein
MFPLRFLRPWNGYDPGREWSCPHEGVAEELVARGVAVRMPPAEAAAPDPPPDTTAATKPKPKPRGNSRGTGTVHA